MNAHQRRKESRRLHMELPLGKQVQLKPLLNRTVYGYGVIGGYFDIDSDTFDTIASATIHRHCNCGEGRTLDLVLTGGTGISACINTSRKGIKLLNKDDKAARPWWVDNMRAAAKAKNGS